MRQKRTGPMHMHRPGLKGMKMNNEETRQSGELQKILYVDDDEDMRLIVDIALTGIGKLDVEICTSWPQARERLRDFTPDLILLDLIMPDVDGMSALNDIRSMNEWRGIPVVFLTAHLEPAGLSANEGMNILGIVRKPFKPNQLANQLREFWNRRKGLT